MARAVLCAVALLLQALVLPLAHAQHVSALRPAGAVFAAGHDNGPAVIRPSTARPAAHDAATCSLCATMAHGRTGTLSMPLGARLGHGAVLVPPPAALLVRACGLRLTSAPRAPPSLSS